MFGALKHFGGNLKRWIKQHEKSGNILIQIHILNTYGSALIQVRYNVIFSVNLAI